MAEGKIVRHYNPAANPDGASWPGVPLRDLTAEEWDAIPPWIQSGIDEDPQKRYRMTPVREERAAPKALDAAAPAPEKATAKKESGGGE